jgi:hypothetical protein
VIFSENYNSFNETTNFLKGEKHMNYKNLAKMVITGAVVLGFGDLMFHAGKGQMLYVLSHHNVTATDMKKILSDSKEKPYPTKVILGVCKMYEEVRGKKEES